MGTTTKVVNDPIFGEMTVITIDPGREVVCDLCNKNFTDLPDSGGFLFGCRAVGPCCTESFRQTVEETGEGAYIVANCPTGKSFADWVREDLR